MSVTAVPPFVNLEEVRYRADANATPLVADDIRIGEGAAVALMGPNGAGKSTLLALSAGLLRPDSGRVVIDGRDLANLDEREKLSFAAGTFQDPTDQLFLPGVRQEIEFGLRQQRIAVEEIGQRVEDSANRLGLGTVLEKKPHDLPAAERRLLTIASAIAARPMLLCLDEPTQDLDAAGVERLGAVLMGRKTAGETTLIATHDSDFAFDLCDYVVVLFEGRVAYHGDWVQLKNRTGWLESHGVNAPTLWNLPGGVSHG